MTNTYQVGAEVAYGRFHWGTPINYGFSRVANVNRYGHVKLENGMVFDKFGYERCDYSSRRYLMQPEVLRNVLDTEKKKQERTEKINRIQNLANMLHYNDNLAETKQQMIELINSL